MKVSSTGRISRRHASLIVDDKVRPLSETANSHGEKQHPRAADTTLPQGRGGEPAGDGPRAVGDHVLEYMREANLPLTRETYLALAYPGGVPNPLSPEQEAIVPPEVK